MKKALGLFAGFVLGLGAVLTLAGNHGIRGGATATGNLVDNAVTEAKIGAGAVTEGKIGYLAVTGTKLAAGIVTSAKLGAAMQDCIPALMVTASDLTGNAGSASVQARDAAGDDLAKQFLVRVWIADAALSEPDAQTDFSVYVGEEMRELEANADYEVISNASGLVTMNIAVSAPKTVHVMAEIAGRIYTTSVAITT